MLAPDRLAELDAFLVELNRAAAAVTLPLFRADHGLEDKNADGGGYTPGFDPVTRADKGAEQAIRALIAARYPNHGVIGEEYGQDRPDADFVWVLDPIDGTRSFIAGLPLWCTLIGMRFQGTPTLGSISQPFLDELYIGHPGASRLVSRGAVRPLKVRACARLAHAVIGTTDPDACFKADEMPAWRALRGQARVIRPGLDSYSYAMLAAGTMDLVVESGLKSWDIEAAIPVIQGAGGAATDWRGAAIGDSGGQVILSGDPACLEETLAVLSPSAA